MLLAHVSHAHSIITTACHLKGLEDYVGNGPNTDSFEDHFSDEVDDAAV